MKSDLEEWFPNLAQTEYEITSPRTYDYNCIAWALEEDDRWWSPTSDEYYWLEGAPTEWSLAAVVQTFGMVGYEACQNADLEPGFQKVAIFTNVSGEPTHAARQLPNGRWTSKLGDWEDIEHELEGIEGEKMYGSVGQILRRSIQTN
jgi:hypothetical protein